MTFYNPAIPTPTLSFADWQTGFLNNFANLSTAFSVNHIPLNASSNAGDHTFIQLLEQAASQQTNLSEFSVYTKKDPSTTDQIFMRYQGNGTEFQFSCYQIYPLIATASQVPFFTFLPGKIMCYFGLFNQTVSTPLQNKIFLNPPIARNIISVNLTPAGGGQSTASSSVTLVTNTNGITTALQLPSPIPSVAPATQYYLVLANI